MAVPRHDAARLDHHLAESQLAVGIFAISLPRSIEPSVVSVTPTALKSTGWRAFGMGLSAGHSPACALNAKPAGDEGGGSDGAKQAFAD